MARSTSILGDDDLLDEDDCVFAAACVANDECVGVAIAGNPSMVWQGTGRIVISRVATPGHENACSMLYGALCRAAKALGYREVWTYTLPEEAGTSLRAAGFQDMGLTDGGEWSRPSRARNPATRPEPKRRERCRHGLSLRVVGALRLRATSN